MSHARLTDWPGRTAAAATAKLGQQLRTCIPLRLAYSDNGGGGGCEDNDEDEDEDYRRGEGETAAATVVPTHMLHAITSTAPAHVTPGCVAHFHRAAERRYMYRDRAL